MKKFFGWLFMTDAYLASLTDEELLIRACSSKREAYARGYTARRIEDNMKRLDELLDNLGVKVYSPPTLIFYEPGENPNRKPFTYTKGSK
jgi:hypothetical protein